MGTMRRSPSSVSKLRVYTTWNAHVQRASFPRVSVLRNGTLIDGPPVRATRLARSSMASLRKRDGRHS